MSRQYSPGHSPSPHGSANTSPYASRSSPPWASTPNSSNTPTSSYGQSQGTPGKHFAQLRDGSLQELLIEAFTVAEIRFYNFDKDACGLIMFKELRRSLGHAGFHDEQRLQEIWHTCDMDRNEAIDFKEFLSLLYLWQYLVPVYKRSTSGKDLRDGPEPDPKEERLENCTGSYLFFYKFRRNAEITAKAFMEMERFYVGYDYDKNRMISRTELEDFLRKELSNTWAHPKTATIINYMYPPNRDVELGFPDFMGFLYILLSAVAPDRLKGCYVAHVTGTGEEKVATPAEMFDKLGQMFAVLEKDFELFDEDRSGRVDLGEIMDGIKVEDKEQRLDMMRLIEYNMMKADGDRTGELDFWQFVFFTFLMAMEGSYQTVIARTQHAAIVKKVFVYLQAGLSQHSEGMFRLTREQFTRWLEANTSGGLVVSNSMRLFDRYKYQSRSMNGAEVVDVPRILRLLYNLLLPLGNYADTKYQPPPTSGKQVGGTVKLEIKQQPVPAAKPTVDPVDPARVVKGKLLGEGAEGRVFVAMYDGKLKCAAKFLLQNPSPKTCENMQREVNLMKMLKHPNCHWLIGSITRLPHVIVLTELCENGSLFDYYTRKLMPKRHTFDSETAKRLSIEAASGLAFLHNMKPSYMHRDVKSLNVFLDDNMVVKVADFGMATSDTESCHPSGTVQWMAPEVLHNLFGRKSMYDKRVDIYSFGIMLWEIYHCLTPYGDTGLDQMSIANAVVQRGIRPQLQPSRCPKEVADLIQACWQTDRTKRPTIDEVLRRLKTLPAFQRQKSGDNKTLPHVAHVKSPTGPSVSPYKEATPPPNQYTPMQVSPPPAGHAPHVQTPPKGQLAPSHVQTPPKGQLAPSHVQTPPRGQLAGPPSGGRIQETFY